MVVPIYKRWEANLVRLQLLKYDRVMQLAAFFSDFDHGECMNFNLKSTDIFETFNRSDKFFVRLVDAKFALPRSGDDETKSFVCLDLPEYPGEHDDITIGFETESGKNILEGRLQHSADIGTLISRLGEISGGSSSSNERSISNPRTAEVDQAQLASRESATSVRPVHFTDAFVASLKLNFDLIYFRYLTLHQRISWNHRKRKSDSKMASPSDVTINGSDQHVKHEFKKLSIKAQSPATIALHADDPLNVVDDVAPPMHVSTTYRYPHNPEALFSVTERGVRTLHTIQMPFATQPCRESTLELTWFT
jgi:hypothetical protein